MDHSQIQVECDDPTNKVDWIKANEETLKRQSRSFAIPILNLDNRFKIPIMVEYNFNKTIDTIEDSTELGADEKILLIEDFCNHLHKEAISRKVQARMLEVTPKEEAYVFSNYTSTMALLKTLSLPEKELIKKWTTEMAEGMCVFLKKPIHTIKDLNDYCYYVAGTAGLFLTNILKVNGSNISKESFQNLNEKAVSFGFFLQKLNIIRDFIEDKEIKKRTFWPSNYFKNENDHVKILNKMCLETFQNDVPKAIEYFKQIPSGNDSYDYFIRFILCSGLEYLKILKNNHSVFSRLKVKLPQLFIKKLYKKVSSQSRKEFINYCDQFLFQGI